MPWRCAASHATWRRPAWASCVPEPVAPAFTSGIGWQIAWPQACPWILGRSIRNLRNGPSPEWLQRRLTSIGLRPISALVDVTNFFTFDLGRPLHVFDAGCLAGRTLTLRRGAGETFTALNGRELTVGADDLVIADDAGVVSLAGIMGGEASGTTEATTEIFLECALFDPVCIARSGRRHQIVSDARQRFERGLDQALPPGALEAATRMILDLCGGAAGTVIEAGAEPAWQRQASLRFERLAGLGGATVAPTEAARILDRLGFAAVEPHPVGAAERITVQVPPWRNDIAVSAVADQWPGLGGDQAGRAAEGASLIEPEADLVEEVLRVVGLDAIPAVSLPQPHAVPQPALSPRQARTALARRLLADRGLAECVTYSFMAAGEAAAFGAAPPALTLKNPIAADLDQMRPTPLATLALAAARNAARGARMADLFEIGPGFTESAPQTATGTVQSLMAAGLRTGMPPRHWQPAPVERGAMAAKSDAWALLAALGVPMEALSVTPDAPAHYHPGRSGTVRQGPKLVLGHFGELHPALLDRFALAAPACAFELDLDAVADPKRRRRPTLDLPSLQPVFRDFAFVVPSSVPADQLLRAARLADRALITEVTLFDVYESDLLPPGHKSLGIEVTFQPRDRTLTDHDLEQVSARLVQAVGKATGARLR
jgi:phenylalanyl-tRNA synthetase beta chain